MDFINQVDNENRVKRMRPIVSININDLPCIKAIVIGSRTSGKTTLFKDFYNKELKYSYDRFIIISNAPNEYDYVENKIDITEYTDGKLKPYYISNKIKQMIVIDDVTKAYESEFIKSIYKNGQYYNTSIVVLTQTLSVDNVVINNCNCVFLFPYFGVEQNKNVFYKIGSSNYNDYKRLDRSLHECYCMIRDIEYTREYKYTAEI